jgi:hypothetical protein
MSETISVKNQINSDQSWINQAFFNASTEILGADGLNRIPDSLPNFYDTSLGGNRSINCDYQYCPATDPRVPSLASGSSGMGNYYMEAIDSNATRITLSFGVPEFNSITRFLANYYDHDLATYATTGRMSQGIFSAFGLGKAIGFVLTLPFQAICGVVNIASKAIAFAGNTPYSKFYYFKQTMNSYWTAVSYIVNLVSINLDLQIGYSAEDYIVEGDGENRQVKVNPDSVNSTGIAAMNALMPDVFKTGEGQSIDVRAVAGKAQRLSDQYNRVLNKLMENSVDFTDYVNKLSAKHATMKLDPAVKSTTADALRKYSATTMGAAKDEVATAPTEEATNQDSSTEGAVVTNDSLDAAINQSSAEDVLSQSDSTSFLDYIISEFREGSMFVNFTVDYNGATTETFSNTTKPLQIKEQIAGLAGTSRDLAVNTGNFFDLGGVVSTFTDMLKGGAASVGLGSLASLGSGAFPDIQDTWDNSTADFGSETYTIKLKCPYPDPITYLQDIIVPMACIMAGGMARTSGKNSYVSPYLCQLDSIGRSRITTGMIDSITVSRGGSNVGWSNHNLPTEVLLTFNIKNLDNIMHVPVADSLLSTLTGVSLFDEETALTNYVGVLAGLSKYNSYYLKPRFKRNVGLWKAAADQITSKSYWAQQIRYSLPGEIISVFMPPAMTLKNL